MKEIAKSVSSEGLCSMWALNRFVDCLYLASCCIVAFAAEVISLYEVNWARESPAVKSLYDSLSSN
jgi:hypothetical protein